MTDGSNQRLDRMERNLELILNDHVLFCQEHKFLFIAQVQMQGGLETLRGQVESLFSDVRQFVGGVEALRQNFDARLKRLET
jgi:predicted component of type VI protein secretion system